MILYYIISKNKWYFQCLNKMRSIMNHSTWNWATCSSIGLLRHVTSLNCSTVHSVADKTVLVVMMLVWKSANWCDIQWHLWEKQKISDIQLGIICNMMQCAWNRDALNIDRNGKGWKCCHSLDRKLLIFNHVVIKLSPNIYQSTRYQVEGLGSHVS
jgi:hypothetical protein